MTVNLNSKTWVDALSNDGYLALVGHCWAVLSVSGTGIPQFDTGMGQSFAYGAARGTTGHCYRTCCYARPSARPGGVQQLIGPVGVRMRPRQSGLWHRLAPGWRTPRGCTLPPASLTGRLCVWPILYGF